MAQIHRYGDKVAGWLGAGTVYMTPFQARLIAQAMLAAADEIEAQPQFSKSTFRTVTVPVDGHKD